MVLSSSSSSLPLCGSSSDSHLATIPIARKWLYVLTIILLIPWGLYTRTTRHLNSVRDDIYKLQELKRKASYQLDAKRQLLEALQTEKKRIQDSNEALVSKIRKAGVLVDTHTDNYEKLEQREEDLLKCIDDLERHVQDNSRFALEQEYGKGPYQVELTMRSKMHMRIKTQTIVVEVSNQAMPHAAHHFLRMVTERLWNNMSFMPNRRAPHRIQASPIDMETLQSKLWHFENAKLTQLSFNEQDKDYKCGSYSIGFVGNGGPDFFVNSLLSPESPESNASESCFGKVVQGKEIIDSIIDKQESAVLGIESLRLL